MNIANNLRNVVNLYADIGRWECDKQFIGDPALLLKCEPMFH